MNDTLVICDIQTSFPKVSQSYVEKVATWLANNLHKYDEVHVLEYEGDSATPDEIMGLVERHDSFYVHEKDQNDGSYHISRYIPDIGVEPRKIDGVGLYAEACLYQTAVGLKEIAHPDTVINIFSDLTVTYNVSKASLRSLYSRHGIKFSPSRMNVRKRQPQRT